MMRQNWSVAWKIAPLLVGLLLTSCTSLGHMPVKPNSSSSAIAHNATEVRRTVVDSAKTLLGQKPNAVVLVRGRKFMLDCIGTVSAAWWGAGFDIQRDFGKFEGNGVARLLESCRAWGAINRNTHPNLGDIVFWDNTYDRNEDGILYNDGPTHAGIVVAIDSDGTVEYLHESVTRGVALAWFNLQHPDVPFSPAGKVWNSPMFLGAGYQKTSNPPRWLSGDLWSAFGSADKVARATIN